MAHAESHGQRVWYAAYGSNLLRERFEVYLTGGRIPGATEQQPQAGARDSSPPADDRPVAIHHTLYFAHRSSRWGNGGVAFLDPRPETGRRTLGRAWNISLGQLADVYRQENRFTPELEIDLEQLTTRGSLDLLGSTYGRLLHVGELDDLPLITFTTAERHAENNPAHRSYLDVIRQGLAESWATHPREIEAYLAAANDHQVAE